MSLTPGIIASSLTGHLITSNFFKIATVTAAGGETSLSFTSIPSTYKSLQVRGIARCSNASSIPRPVTIQFNADTGSNYVGHGLQGQSSAVNANGFVNLTAIGNNATNFWAIGNSATSGIFGAGIVDIIDYASTSKYKTLRSISGVDNNGTTNPGISLQSGLWQSTAAINEIDIGVGGYTFIAGSTFTLYGVS